MSDENTIDDSIASRGLDALSEFTAEYGLEDDPHLANVKEAFVDMAKTHLEHMEAAAPKPEPELAPPEKRFGWMDHDTRISAYHGDEQKRAEKVDRQEISDREDAILGAIFDGDRDKAARIGGKRAEYFNMQR